MPRGPRSPKREILTFPVRAPKELIEAFDKAIEIGFITARSRNEAIVKLIESFLNDISFVISAFEEAKERAKSPKYQNSGLPPELLHLQLALEIIDPTKNPSAGNITAKYQSIIMTTLANSKNPELDELKAKLNSLLNQDEEDENE